MRCKFSIIFSSNSCDVEEETINTGVSRQGCQSSSKAVLSLGINYPFLHFKQPQKKIIGFKSEESVGQKTLFISFFLQQNTLLNAFFHCQLAPSLRFPLKHYPLFPRSFIKYNNFLIMRILLKLPRSRYSKPFTLLKNIILNYFLLKAHILHYCSLIVGNIYSNIAIQRQQYRKTK